MAASKTIRWFNLVAALRGAVDGLATTEVHRRLQEMPGVDPVDVRTIQRDLAELADIGIVAPEDEDRDGRGVWCLDRRFRGIDEDPAMTGSVALTLKMAIEHAAIQLPLDAQAFLLGQSARIERALQGEGARGRIPWADKVRVAPSVTQRRRSGVARAVVETIYHCLAAERRMRAVLPMLDRAGSVRLEISPLGLVYQHQSLLLVGWVHERSAVEAIDLERIREAIALDDSIERPEGFDLDEFIWSGGIDDDRNEPLRVQLRCSHRLADIWRHTPLGRHQVISDSKYKPLIEATCEATCEDNDLFLGYLFSLGTEVTVIGPQELVKRIADLAYTLVMRHSAANSDDLVVHLGAGETAADPG